MMSLFFMCCLLLVVGCWLWDVGCGFECTVPARRYHTLIDDTGAFVEIRWCERHLKIFDIC